MVAGRLQEKKGFFYIVLSFKDFNGKFKTKWVSTGLPVKGNKKRAEEKLLEERRNFKVPTPMCEEEKITFADYMLNWLEMVKSNIELSTYASYCFAIKNVIVPYFKEKKVLLNDLQPKQIQDFYSYHLNERGVTARTVIHYHANIRKALQYAVMTELLQTNPADKVQRPKMHKYVGSFYDNDEMNKLFDCVRGKPIELPVMLAAFYGLRRSEIIGLKWDAIDFKNKLISIRHTVTEASIDGVYTTIAKDRTKTKSSFRVLPLVPVFETKLSEIMMKQEERRRICKKGYLTEYLGYINVNEIGGLIKPGYITQHFQIELKNNNLRKIRFHDLRHSCASLLLANGVPMKQIQEWLGHSDFSTTANLYVHLDVNAKINSANAMLQSGINFGQV